MKVLAVPAKVLVVGPLLCRLAFTLGFVPGVPARALATSSGTSSSTSGRSHIARGMLPATVLSKFFPSEDLRVLDSFMMVKSHNVDDAAAHYQMVQKWREEVGPVTISDIEPHLRSGAYMITLEQGADNTRPRNHAPIILMNGMFKGSREEMVRQVIYVAERAWANMPSDRNPCIKFLVNSRAPSFRFPDSDFRHALNVMRYHYPWSLNCKVIFLDLPSPIAGMLKMVGNVFDKVYTERFEFCKTKDLPGLNDADIKGFLANSPNNNLLKWDGHKGRLQFDLDGYIKGRSAAENLEVQAQPQPQAQKGRVMSVSSVSMEEGTSGSNDWGVGMML